MIVAILLTILAAPLVAPVADERPIGDVVVGPAPYSNGEASVATDGQNFFVVWRDGRDGNAILANRIAQDGTMLESGIEIVRSRTADRPYSAEPKVLWTGGSYVVFWRSSYFRDEYSSIWVARYSRDGVPLDGPHIVVERTREPHAVAFNGSHFLLSYLDPFGLRPRAWLLDVDAKPVKALLLADTEIYPGASMTSTARGSEFLVAWDQWVQEAQSDFIKAVRVDRSGDVVPGARTIGTGRYPLVASDGVNYLLLTWQPSEPWKSRIVSGDLVPITATRDVSGPVEFSGPTVIWSGDRYLVATRELTMIDRNGDFIGTPTPLLTDAPGVPTGTPSIAVSTSSRFLVTWTALRFGTDSTAVARLYDGRPPVASAPSVVLSASANRQVDPDIARGQSGELVVWRERDGVFATRVSSFGVSVDGRGIELSRDLSAGPPRVVFNGTDYVVAWREWNSLQVRYISPATGLRPEKVQIEAFGFDPNVGLALTNDAAYVAWSASQRVWLVRIAKETRAADGVALPVSPDNVGAIDAALSSNGSQLLVAWHEVTEEYGYPFPFESIVGRTWAARVDANMTLLDSAPLLLGENGEAYPHVINVASNGADWLLSWLASQYVHDTGGHEQRVVARRVLQSGMVDGNAPSILGEGVASSLFWNGTDYVIARKGDHNTGVPRYPLHLGIISASGAPVIRNEVAIVETESGQERFSLTTISGRIALIYARMSRAPEHGSVDRVFLRLIGNAPRRRAIR
jgi:hypothetical protein